MASPSEVVHIAIFDWNKFRQHVFMGEAIVDLCDFSRRGAKKLEWYPLTKPDSISTGVSGEVCA